MQMTLWQAKRDLSTGLANDKSDLALGTRTPLC